jgi:hypothetical protein
MTDSIKPSNRMAQLFHLATGNPVNTLPISAISNCFPGLEYDFKNFWRRAFEGVVFLESDNYVIETDEAHKHLLHHRLLLLDGKKMIVTVSGPQIPGGNSSPLTPAGNPGSVAFPEWSNALSFVMRRQGQTVKCHFTKDEATSPMPIPDDKDKMLEVDLVVRKMLVDGSVAPEVHVLEPGELTQGLCSPWQHDYRECACYYWPASRPDYVNIENTPQGISRGDNWMSKERSGEYVLDDRKDSRMVSYDDLFMEWEKMLQFQIKGCDAKES